MSKLDNRLAAFGDEFTEWFEDPIKIWNYEDAANPTGPEEFDNPDDKQPTADSPIETTAQVDLRGGVAGEGSPWGRDINLDVEVWISGAMTEDAAYGGAVVGEAVYGGGTGTPPISDGEEPGLPYPSDIEHVPTGRRFRVSAIHESGDDLRIAATRLREHH